MYAEKGEGGRSKRLPTGKRGREGVGKTIGTYQRSQPVLVYMNTAKSSFEA